jgi:hypothetical protein
LLLPITPFVILPLGSLLDDLPKKSHLNLLLAALIAVSITVQIPGVFVNYGRFLQKVYELSVDRYYQRVTFQIAYSPLIGQWGEMREVVGNLKDPAMRSTVAQFAFEKETDELDAHAMDLLAYNLPDFWFIYLSFSHNHFQKPSVSSIGTFATMALQISVIGGD